MRDAVETFLGLLVVCALAVLGAGAIVFVAVVGLAVTIVSRDDFLEGVALALLAALWIYWLLWCGR